MSDKLHFGLICNHVTVVAEETDAYCVECSDGVVDVCSNCYGKHTEIKNINNPFDGVSEYWFDGTMRELLSVINGK